MAKSRGESTHCIVYGRDVTDHSQVSSGMGLYGELYRDLISLLRVNNDERDSYERTNKRDLSVY